jgi:3'-phosphoadenosine 5'-phosphosulfate sulfotransferase (PAPS reductase)/FAD synthetase
MPDWSDYGITGKIHHGKRSSALPWKARIEKKSEAAREVIREALERTEGRAYVAVSFGVDSLVTWHLAQSVAPIKAAWINQGPFAEWPDCLALKDHMLAEGMDLDEIQPDITLYDWYKRHGIPLSSSMNSKEDKALNKALMYDPISRWEQANDMRCTIWGIRGAGDEGKHRKVMLSSKKLLFKMLDGRWRCSPVGWWSKQEIWQYIDLHGLAYPAMYDINRLEIRNGPPIGVTAINLGRVEKLKRDFPEIWRVFVSEFPDFSAFR